MIAAIWNVRGINKPLKRRKILSFARQNHVSFFALLETRTTPTKLDKIIKGIFPSENVFVDFNTIRNGRIVLVWNSHKVDCTILDVSAQCIHCALKCKTSNKIFQCSIVYGLYSVVERRQLWNKLMELNPQSNVPWLVCGDFNVVKCPEEKQGGVIPSNYFTKDFVDCCSSLGLSDAPSIGNFFTWTNGRVKAKLDRVLSNALWTGSSFNCWVDFKDFDCMSDHCPIIIKMFNSQESINRPFKFFNMWLTHPKFKQILLDTWTMNIHGSRQYTFVRKLKALKAPLKILNKEDFGHISEKALAANSAYNDFLHSADFNEDSEDNRIVLQGLRSKALFLAEAERQFISQKLKLKHLIDADKSTKYFHDLVKKSNKDRSITCILDQHGIPTTSLTQVGALFIRAYLEARVKGDRVNSISFRMAPKFLCLSNIF
ncbi:PREDICTED: uncharacterized protein LOC109184888 [Ipomoea nil]|uniref:uncharacterized protein LOC109152086 n=1 Tax=Ipomoea nil TaxID=35883 RepID=UPI00090164EC|nr:PREDICTED: uncharacterized protein LOC109152086 [Ipomoea nil]XP_019190482.1 PREDICTED: uncharacterized protein LOC109184888 [Ipomoea nil]